MADITELTMIEMAKKTDDPFIYVMVLLDIGFRPDIYRKLANKCWNKIHPEKQLPK